MTLLKKIVIGVFVIYFSFMILNFITSPYIYSINHTGQPIRFNSLQYSDTGDEPTEEELNEWKLTYHIEKEDSKKLTLYRRHRFSRENIYLSVDYTYDGAYLTAENESDLKGVTFSDEPNFKNQKSYCAFNVKVYPNRKTIVIPTRSWGCIKPMYYYDAKKENKE